MVCPCWPSVPCKTGRSKTATGHLYYAVFSVIYHCAVSFFLFKLFLSSVGLSVLNIVILLLGGKNFKQVPFLSDNLLYERILPLKSCKDEQTNARSSFKSFYFESAKNHKYYLVAEESTTALRRQQTQLNLENKHTDFFYSSDILLKNVLTVGISERQRCMSRGVGRCSLLKSWLN